jgi:hypothetical protein
MHYSKKLPWSVQGTDGARAQSSAKIAALSEKYRRPRPCHAPIFFETGHVK